MKTHGQSVVLAGICASALCITSAHAQMDRFYVGADAGGLLTLDTRVKEFLGPVAPDTKLKLDPGVRVGFVGGYKFTDWFSLEGETGFMANNISSITGGNIDGDATLANVPFLLNARFQLPHGRCPITPYFGGGAGGSATILDFQNHAEINGNHLSGNDSDVVFAYQAFAGLRYAINDHMGIGVEYHYFATTGASYTADTFGTSSDRLSFAGVQSHAITAAFDYHF
jgi:OmpA-OmpF porin, OOP family